MLSIAQYSHRHLDITKISCIYVLPVPNCHILHFRKQSAYNFSLIEEIVNYLSQGNLQTITVMFVRYFILISLSLAHTDTSCRTFAVRGHERTIADDG